MNLSNGAAPEVADFCERARYEWGFNSRVNSSCACLQNNPLQITF